MSVDVCSNNNKVHLNFQQVLFRMTAELSGTPVYPPVSLLGSAAGGITHRAAGSCAVQSDWQAASSAAGGRSTQE